jgi:predicted RNA-binding protein with PUA-like domain
MRDTMKVGDLVLFYHSNCKPPHIAGIARVCKEGYTDFTALDEKSNYFDHKSSADNPRWCMVDIEPIIGFKQTLSLPDLKQNPKLEGMPLLKKGQRLSVQPVPKKYFNEICKIAEINQATM